MQIPSFVCSGTTVIELREFNDKKKKNHSNPYRVSNEISTDMNNRTHYNSDWERYRLMYITNK